MKKSMITLTATALTAAAITFTSCASNPSAQQAGTIGAAGSITTDAGGIPCLEYDTQEYITGFGEYRGSSAQFGVLVYEATARARRNALQKLGGQYKGMSTDFIRSYGNNQGNDLADKMVTATEQAINKVLDDARTSCSSQGVIGPDGHQSVFIGIRIYKNEIAAAAATAITNKLTDDEKRSIDFEEKVFKEQYQKAFENFSTQNAPQ